MIQTKKVKRFFLFSMSILLLCFFQSTLFAVTQQEVDSAKTSYEQAKKTLEAVEKEIENYKETPEYKNPTNAFFEYAAQKQIAIGIEEYLLEKKTIYDALLNSDSPTAPAEEKQKLATAKAEYEEAEKIITPHLAALDHEKALANKKIEAQHAFESAEKSYKELEEKFKSDSGNTDTGNTTQAENNQTTQTPTEGQGNAQNIVMPTPTETEAEDAKGFSLFGVQNKLVMLLVFGLVLIVLILLLILVLRKKK